MRVLSWNLFHGRSVPATRQDLLDAYTEMLAGWRWDVALLQEVPPWWPPVLARACGAEQRTALTSRNLGLPLRRALARRDPELIKSNGGGCNAILTRIALESHRAVRLRTWPERRVAQIAALGGGIVVANFHGSTQVALAENELSRLGALTLSAAAPTGAPAVLGGDLNLRAPKVSGMEHVAARDVDHVFAAGLRGTAGRVLDHDVVLEGGRAALSDHPPLLAELAAL